MLKKLYTFKISKYDNIIKSNIQAYVSTYTDTNDHYKQVLFTYSNCLEKAKMITYLEFIEINFKNNLDSYYDNMPLHCSDSFINSSKLRYNQLIYCFQVDNTFDLDSITIQMSQLYLDKNGLTDESIASKLIVDVLNDRSTIYKEENNKSIFTEDNEIVVKKCSPLKQGKLSLKTEIIIIKSPHLRPLQETARASDPTPRNNIKLNHFQVKTRESLSSMDDKFIYSIPFTVIHNTHKISSNDINQDIFNCIFINTTTSLNLKLDTGDLVEINQGNNVYRTNQICVLNDDCIEQDYMFYITSHLHFNASLNTPNIIFRVS